MIELSDLKNSLDGLISVQGTQEGPKHHIGRDQVQQESLALTNIDSWRVLLGAGSIM